MTAKFVRQGEDEREFDRQFWRQLLPEERVECLWDMVLEARALKGLDDEPRLQRSVLRIERR
jgi:hypothetical protein